ncbi:MAG: CoA transferase [Streptosporangiales bacterium]|nr:CoA transferase [Streptosporangiales bacterium]
MLVGPLAGTRVVEVASFIGGPYAAMLLADLGAEVVKVELPGTGDPFRQWSERQGRLLPQVAAYNRGKKSVSINVQTESGRDLFRRLAATADVVVENFRPGTLDRLGIGYEALRKSNPKLVYCAISGMGSSGPYRDRPTYDAIAQAMSGLWSQFTDPSDPQPIGPPLADQLTGMYAAYGVLAALAAQRAGGAGQKVEVSMLSSCIAFLTAPVSDYLMTGEIGHQFSRARRSQSYAFVASDGLPFAVHLSSPPKFWERLTQVAGRPELVDDPRFKQGADRIKNYQALHEELSKVFRTRAREEWLTLLEQHDVPSAPIYNVAETLADPQVRHIGMVKAFGQGERALDLVGSAASFSENSDETGLPPPNVGEHNGEIFGALGYTDEELERMRGEGAI